jgi:hypothetical protein
MVSGYKAPVTKVAAFETGKGSAIGAVTPEREKRQAAVDSNDALIGAERLS